MERKIRHHQRQKRREDERRQREDAQMVVPEPKEPKEPELPKKMTPEFEKCLKEWKT